MENVETMWKFLIKEGQINWPSHLIFILRRVLTSLFCNDHREKHEHSLNKSGTVPDLLLAICSPGLPGLGSRPGFLQSLHQKVDCFSVQQQKRSSLKVA